MATVTQVHLSSKNMVHVIV